MKSIRHALFLCFVLLSSITNAQSRWSSYHYSVDATKYQGKKFKLEAWVKSKGSEDNSSAYLWVRVDKSNNERGFSDEMYRNPIKNPEWKKYTIEGTIDEGAEKLFFGTWSMFNGDFYFDDLKLSILNSKNKWEKVYEEDFENKSSTLKQGSGKQNVGINDLYSSTVENLEKTPNGKYYLKITGKNIPNYGQNKQVGKFADVNGIKLYYEIYGEGQPLLVLHGNGGDISNAGNFYPELMKKYKVIAVDSRGQGKSTDTDKPLTYDQMASDINELLNVLKIDSVNVWGQSDGGILSLLLAKDYPKKVRRALAFGANIQPDKSAIHEWSIDYEAGKIANPKTSEKERKLLVLMRDYPNLDFKELNKIKAPVLIMSGDRDFITLEHTIKMFQNIPNSHLCVIPGSTHGASWEKQDLFLKILYDFFDKPFEMPDTKSWIEE